MFMGLSGRSCSCQKANGSFYKDLAFRRTCLRENFPTTIETIRICERDSLNHSLSHQHQDWTGILSTYTGVTTDRTSQRR